MLRPIFTCIFMLICTSAFSQSYTIKGTLMDTLNSNGLPSASVTLIQQADSIMEGFTRTDDNGNFLLQPSKPGKYIVLITFPSFVDYVDVVEVKDEKPVNLGQIPMVTRAHLLKEFVFTQQLAAIKVKGDTVEYVADSFKVKDNATVEALLKKLPGIQVNRNGEIVAQGEKVEKVLVDGEEFFSDDPAMVTKSLQAKVVDKVQVFDKKSEQAEFTGIDDGEKTKTINLQLKDDKKKGYFGKVIAGGGAGDERGYFENQAMINAFKGKRKISAFGIASNTGRIGLGWEDRDKFGSSAGNTVVSDEGYITTYYDGEDDMFSWDGKYNGKGLPLVYSGGVHYSNKWLDEKHHLAGNYRYQQQQIDIDNQTTTQYILPNGSYNTNRQDLEQSNTGNRNRGDINYTIKTDSLSEVKVNAVVGYNENKSNSELNSDMTNSDGNKLNETSRSQTSQNFVKTINSNLDWKQKFKKKGRTFSLNLTENYRESTTDGFLRSVNTYYDTTGNIRTTDTIDQRKQNANKNMSLSSRVAYTEPISKVTFVEVNYSFKLDNNSADRITNDKNQVTADYINKNQLYSSNYDFEVMTHTGGANLKFVFKKINFSLGSSLSNATFKQTDVDKDTTYTYAFTNLFPRANFTYKFSKQSNASFNYNGNTRQPTLEQIQPLRDNNDPLNIAVGNPGLTQEFRHSLVARYNTYKPLTGRYMGGYVSLNLIDDAITRTETVNDSGVRYFQHINMDGNYSGWVGTWFGFNIKKLNTRLNFNLNSGINHSNNLVNGRKNTSDNNNYSLGVNLSYESKDEKLSFSFGPDVTYNDFRSTLALASTSYWVLENNFDASYELPKKFEIGSDFNWFIREKTPVFTSNNNVFKWNAYVAKKFLKSDQLELRVAVIDILNQNLGFTRTANANYITEDRYNTIRRYGLLTLTWNFSKSPLTAAPEQPMIITK